MSEIAKSTAKGVAAGICFALGLCFLVALISVFADIPDGALDVISALIFSAAAYLAGFVSTQICRSKGLVQGVICGLALFLTALLLSAAFKKIEFSDIAAMKFALSLCSGAVGGVKGINTKKTKERH